MSQIVMPKFGLTMTEGLITRWAVNPGQTFVTGDILFEVETDKVTNEVLATEDGTLAEILQPEGSVVPVGEPIARLGGDGVTPSAAPADAQPAAAKTCAQSQGCDAPSARNLMAEHGISRDDITGTGRDGRVMKEDVLRVIATPLARRLAKAEGVDLGQVAGSGPNGRIKAADVAARAAATPAPSVQAASTAGLIAPDSVRAATARRVQAAKRDIPHFYLTRHVDIGPLSDLRSQLNASDTRVRISVTHLLTRATGLALAAHPELNQLWLADGILTLDTIGVGIVTETPAGLRIPVIDGVDKLDLDALALKSSAVFDRARKGQLSSADVSGGVISISNVGMFGADTLTPIISPPQAMILGVGAEQQTFRPDPEGRPVLKRELILTLAADHRLIDGAMAARFLATLTRLLETPLELLRPAATP